MQKNQYPNQYFQMLGFPTEQRGDNRNYMRWNPPGVMLLDVGMTRAGGPPSEGISIPAAHLLTPETATSTHYFWGMARNFRLEEIELSATLLRVGMDVFQKEDKPFIEAQQRAIGESADLFALKPALLQTDRAAVRARPMLASILRTAAAGTPPPTKLDGGQRLTRGRNSAPAPIVRASGPMPMLHPGRAASRPRVGHVGAAW